jgi:hypothetical protein
MTQSHKRAIWTLCIWGSVALAFVVFFFFVGSPDSYANTKPVRIAVGIVFAIGYLSYAGMLYLTRIRSGNPSIIADERDELIAGKGSNAGMIVVLIYVFLLAISLWENFQDEGCVPVGWMWWLAYSTTFMAYISSSVAILILHRRSDDHG